MQGDPGMTKTTFDLTDEFRQGQRVRVVWPDESALEGTIDIRPKYAGGVAILYFSGFTAVEWVRKEGALVTVIAEPPVQEPLLVGAVVTASAWEGGPRMTWSLAGNPEYDSAGTRPKLKWHSPGYDPRNWGRLFNPVIEHEGWAP